MQEEISPRGNFFAERAASDMARRVLNVPPRNTGACEKGPSNGP
jgi:hypothetical protein